MRDDRIEEARGSQAYRLTAGAEAIADFIAADSIEAAVRGRARARGCVWPSLSFYEHGVNSNRRGRRHPVDSQIRSGAVKSIGWSPRDQ